MGLGNRRWVKEKYRYTLSRVGAGRDKSGHVVTSWVPSHLALLEKGFYLLQQTTALESLVIDYPNSETLETKRGFTYNCFWTISLYLNSSGETGQLSSWRGARWFLRPFPMLWLQSIFPFLTGHFTGALLSHLKVDLTSNLPMYYYQWKLMQSLEDSINEGHLSGVVG